MAISAFMWFQGYDGKYLESESQVDFSSDPQKSALHYPPNQNIFQIENYAFDVVQTLNIGSQSTGAGAGKITFNPFSITRKSDKSSPVLFQMACSGTAFQTVALVLRRSAGGPVAGAGFLKFTFKLVAVKSISWGYDPDESRETISFEYGGLVVEYFEQQASGSFSGNVLGGWNRVANTADHSAFTIVK
jgi:type VI protein secretion system component Hcp